MSKSRPAILMEESAQGNKTCLASIIVPLIWRLSLKELPVSELQGLVIVYTVFAVYMHTC